MHLNTCIINTQQCKTVPQMHYSKEEGVGWKAKGLNKLRGAALACDSFLAFYERVQKHFYAKITNPLIFVFDTAVG